MIFNTALYAALAIFSIGLIFKVFTWFRYSLGVDGKDIPFSGRVAAAIRGVFSTLFSSKILILIRVFIFEVLLQSRTFKQSVPRWVMHMLIFGGFMLLLVLHALEIPVTSRLFPDYASTLNPFLLIRNLSLAMVLTGLGIAFYRRHRSKTGRLFSHAMDHYLLILLAVIMISGLLLEGSKIVSYKRYQNMMEDYGDVEGGAEAKALESFWVAKFGVASPNVKGPFDEATLSQGKQLHETNCAACHSRPQWAFLSYGVSRGIKPLATVLDRLNIPLVLWYIHFLTCFIGLAYLPFSKMFHIVTSPLSLLVNAVMDNERSDPANIATRQIMELDACTHCGTCNERCSVAVAFEEIPNSNILPSEKMAAVKALASGKKLDENDLKRLQEGIYLCTNCYRCTEVCPVGINLQELWFNVREKLIQEGYPELLTLSPLSFYRGLRRDRIPKAQFRESASQIEKAIANECPSIDTNDRIDKNDMDKAFKEKLAKSSEGGSFVYCFTCMTCTSACPVCRNYENPPEALGLVPHQIIRAAALGLPDMVYRSNMLWRCLGCYQCQDSCPQGVRLTDIFYELKNLATERLRDKLSKP
ncbi:MAG: 4Fe-4S dicluster domain-containing protein [Deltaproteobacteria bacterium]|nr:4Fe-4S dicluster domain-containing protein [Deltaproteobacteria bacterium]